MTAIESDVMRRKTVQSPVTCVTRIFGRAVARPAQRGPPELTVSAMLFDRARPRWFGLDGDHAVVGGIDIIECGNVPNHHGPEGHRNS
jgi:hypothetical protein